MTPPDLPAVSEGLDAALMHRAAPPGSMRYFSLLFAPAEQRPLLAAVYLLEVELRDSASATHDVAHVRLQWWREEIDRLSRGKAQHPATRVMARAYPSGIDFGVLQNAVLAGAMDLAGATFETEAELDRYFLHSSGALLEVAAHCLSTGGVSERALTAVQHAARLLRQTETFRDLRKDSHRGRVYLPLRVMDEMHIAPERIAQAAWPEALVQWLQTRCHQQLIEFRGAVDALDRREKSMLRPVLVLAALHERLAERMARDRFAHSHVRAELSAFEKLWTAWRTALAAR